MMFSLQSHKKEYLMNREFFFHLATSEGRLHHTLLWLTHVPHQHSWAITTPAIFLRQFAQTQFVCRPGSTGVDCRFYRQRLIALVLPFLSDLANTNDEYSNTHFRF